MQIVEPQYVMLPVKTTKADATRKLEKYAVIPPLRLALALRDRRPELLFCSEQKQVSFMKQSGPQLQIPRISYHQLFAYSQVQLFGFSHSQIVTFSDSQINWFPDSHSLRFSSCS